MDGIIFDIDGTLWDSTECVARAWSQCYNEETGKERIFTSKYLKTQFGKLLSDIAADAFYDESRERQLSLIDLCCQEEHRALLRERPDTYPGVEQMFKELSEKYRLFIVSNCQAGYIEVFLEATGLSSYITDKLCPGDSGEAKAANIKSIVNKHQLKKPVYVGDTLGDFQASHEAGVPFVFAAYGFGEVEKPDYVIERPLDMVTLF